LAVGMEIKIIRMGGRLFFFFKIITSENDKLSMSRGATFADGKTDAWSTSLNLFLWL
jgi:hypothetical protein